MSEQTANLCTTDACEALRARLAKYEDAEGRPAVDESWRLIKNKELRNVERLRSLSNHLLQCAHCAVKPDISIDGSGKILMFHDCLAFENRRIVKVSGDDKHIINTWENLTFPPEEEKTYNIAALKTKPSGVVLPGENAVMRLVLREMGNSRHVRGTSNWCADVGMAVVREVARLNSSPVSLNQCDGCRAGIPAENGMHAMGIPGGYADKMMCTAILYESAPSRGDQVRDGWQLVPCQPTDAMVQAVLNSGMYHTPATAWPILVEEYKAMLAAAPSAASQDQGE
jgi:hypothetical protein